MIFSILKYSDTIRNSFYLKTIQKVNQQLSNSFQKYIINNSHTFETQSKQLQNLSALANQINIYQIFAITPQFQQLSKFRMGAKIHKHNVEKKIKQVINSKYYKYQQYLDLNDIQKYSLVNSGLWKKIIMSRDWSMLKKLTLHECTIGDQDIIDIRDLKWPNLQYFSLNSNQISSKGMQILMMNQWPKLDYLSINSNKIDSQGMNLLILNCQNMPKLKELRVDSNYIGYLGFRCLDKSQIFGINISILNISCNNIGSRGIALLVKFSLPKLSQIQLQNCHIGDQGMLHLTKINWPSLTQISIGNNDMQLTGFESYIKMELKKITLMKVMRISAIQTFIFNACNLYKVPDVHYELISHFFMRHIQITRAKRFVKNQKQQERPKSL